MTYGDRSKRFDAVWDKKRKELSRDDFHSWLIYCVGYTIAFIGDKVSDKDMDTIFQMMEKEYV